MSFSWDCCERQLGRPGWADCGKPKKDKDYLKTRPSLQLRPMFTGTKIQKIIFNQTTDNCKSPEKDQSRQKSLKVIYKQM